MLRRRRKFEFSDLERAISTPRAARYLLATKNDLTGAVSPSAALSLYEHNARLSAAAWATVASIEITLRNVIAESLTDYHAKMRPGAAVRWYDEPRWFPATTKWFTAETMKSIEVAMRRANDPGPSAAARPAQGKIVAELTLGFWSYLLVARHEHSLWNRAIRARFPALSDLSGSDSRKIVHGRTEALNYLRNRVAHHEPIYEPFTIPGRATLLDPETVLRDATELIAWADPIVGSWIGRNNRFADVARSRRQLSKR